MIDNEKILKVCEQIRQDCENDANGLDGQPFNGKTMATQMGNQLAMIATLSDMIKLIIEDNVRKDRMTLLT